MHVLQADKLGPEQLPSLHHDVVQGFSQSLFQENVIPIYIREQGLVFFKSTLQLIM